MFIGTVNSSKETDLMDSSTMTMSGLSEAIVRLRGTVAGGESLYL